MRRTIYLIGGLAIILLVMVLGYLLSGRSKNQAPGVSVEDGYGSLPEDSAGRNDDGWENGEADSGGNFADSLISDLPMAQKFKKITDEPTDSYYIGSGFVNIIRPDGIVEKISGDKKDVLSSAPIPNMSKSSFSPDGEKILVMLSSEGGEQGSVYDLKSRAWKLLPEEAKFPSWGPSGSQIIYATEKTIGETKIVTLDLGSEKSLPLTILSLAGTDIIPRWITKNKILIGEKSGAMAKSSLLAFDLKSKRLDILASGVGGLVDAWNSSGTKSVAFASKSTGKGGSLALMNEDWTERQVLSFLSLPQKCAFGTLSTPSSSQAVTEQSTASSSTKSVLEYLYCAVPRDGQKMKTAALPDDYASGVFYSTDNLYSINLSDGSIGLLRDEKNEFFDIEKISQKNNSLYFLDRYSRSLYSLSLE